MGDRGRAIVSEHCPSVLGDGKVRDGLTVTRNENRDDETVLCDGSASDKMDDGVRDIVKVNFDGNDVQYR